jgi:hypothetical protein
MSLNKYDFDAHRRAKRMRALKIDFIIIVMTLVIGIWMMIDHPPPAPNAPAFHKAQKSSEPSSESSITDVLARSSQ